MPFLQKGIVSDALDAASRALRPGRWMLPDVFGGPPERLSELLIALRNVRSGGHPWEASALLALLEDRGYASLSGGAAYLAPACPVVRGTGLIACPPHRANPVVNDQIILACTAARYSNVSAHTQAVAIRTCRLTSHDAVGNLTEVISARSV
jgi:hypothetical protein